MPKKKKPSRPRARVTRVEAAEKEAEAVARQIGELQKRHRAKVRELEDLSPPVKGSAYAHLPENVLFEGGNKVNSQSEDADDPFTAEDLMLSRKSVTDKTTNLFLYHTTGKKKGEPKFRSWSGGLKRQNEKKLRGLKGKKVTITITYEKNKQGKTTHHKAKRTVTYRDYPALVAEYRDTFREDVLEPDSDASYGVNFVTFEPEETKRKGPKKKAKKGKRKKGSRAATRKGKRTARGRRRRMGTGKKASRKHSKPRKRT